MVRLCRTSLCMLSLLLLSLSISTTKGNDGLITRVCSRVKVPSLCNKVLRADHRSATADLKGLGFVSLDIASSKARKNSGLVGSLFKSTTDKILKSGYKVCVESYQSGIQNLGEAKLALTKGDIMNFRTKASAVLTDVSTCVDGFEGTPGVSPELQQANKEMEDLSSIPLAIGAILDGK